MKELGIRAKHKKKFKVTTDSWHHYQVAENLLNRDFNPAGPNQCWVSDITYIYTKEGWLYLAAVMDLYSRKLIGWAMGTRLTKELVIKALNMAIGSRHPALGLLMHSDRGSQYASHEYQKLLQKHGMICSMSGKGNCYDNAVMESFFHTLKVELIYDDVFETRLQARRCIFEYIEVFYNRIRTHSAMGYYSPEDYEKLRKAA
jgi:putative transposase